MAGALLEFCMPILEYLIGDLKKIKARSSYEDRAFV